MEGNWVRLGLAGFANEPHWWRISWAFPHCGGDDDDDDGDDFDDGDDDDNDD